MKCLIPNIGSTSFKYRLLDLPGETVLASGRVERIGQPGGECPDYPSAIRKCMPPSLAKARRSHPWPRLTPSVSRPFTPENFREPAADR